MTNFKLGQKVRIKKTGEVVKLAGTTGFYDGVWEVARDKHWSDLYFPSELEPIKRGRPRKIQTNELVYKSKKIDTNLLKQIEGAVTAKGLKNINNILLNTWKQEIGTVRARHLILKEIKTEIMKLTKKCIIK